MQPLICVKCKVQMKCKKNGVIARSESGWCRNGDLYYCEECSAEILFIPVTAKGFRFGTVLNSVQVVDVR